MFMLNGNNIVQEEFILNSKAKLKLQENITTCHHFHFLYIETTNPDVRAFLSHMLTESKLVSLHEPSTTMKQCLAIDYERGSYHMAREIET